MPIRTHPLETVGPGVDVDPYPSHDGPHRPPGDAQQFHHESGLWTNATAHPGGLVVEVPGVSSPWRARGTAATVGPWVATGHPGRIGLQEDPTGSPDPDCATAAGQLLGHSQDCAARSARSGAGPWPVGGSNHPPPGPLLVEIQPFDHGILQPEGRPQYPCFSAPRLSPRPRSRQTARKRRKQAGCHADGLLRHP